MPSGDRNYNRTNNNAVFYCCSHGVTHPRSHQSASCRNPKEDHKTEATFFNQMGGRAKGIWQGQGTNNKDK
eukprot:196558-Ditylum_brightwellii.AAC.1